MATPIDTVTVFDCPICLEKLSIPKYLPCLHTFCTLCIQTFIEKFKKKSSFLCPVCRLEVSTPEANITSEEWACKLPLNHLLLSLQDASEKSNSQDVLCEPCKRASEKRNAKFYCRDCMDSLCESCLTYHHRRIRHYESHIVTDISKYPQEVMTKELIVEEPCMIHKNKVLEVYCFDHETLCCSVCFATLHRKCDEVKSLEEVVEKMGENIHPANINSALASIKAKADTEINKTKNNFKQLEHKHAQIVGTVVAHVEEAKRKLETLKNTFIKDFQIVHDNEKSLLSNTEFAFPTTKCVEFAFSTTKCVEFAFPTTKCVEFAFPTTKCVEFASPTIKRNTRTISENKLCETYPEPALQESVNENKVSLNVSPSKPEGNPFNRAKPNTMKLPAPPLPPSSKTYSPNN
ncbi:E3 ubiquitin-protein ligase TRIM56-like [Saccostrea cucullata]|uniref:E3 ubiquitin-protein ligase TRIM56-like n=1 Tax=Saccostrea cuccullata TaxID=36930 RepID=UPI002ED2E5A1